MLKLNQIYTLIEANVSPVMSTKKRVRDSDILDSENVYPLFNCYFQNGSAEDGVYTRNFTLLFLDLEKQNESDKNNVIEAMELEALRLQNKLKNIDGLISLTKFDITPIEQFNSDYTAGVQVELSISEPYGVTICAPTLEPTLQVENALIMGDVEFNSSGIIRGVNALYVKDGVATTLQFTDFAIIPNCTYQGGVIGDPIANNFIDIEIDGLRTFKYFTSLNMENEGANNIPYIDVTGGTIGGCAMPYGTGMIRVLNNNTLYEPNTDRNNLQGGLNSLDFPSIFSEGAHIVGINDNDGIAADTISEQFYVEFKLK